MARRADAVGGRSYQHIRRAFPPVARDNGVYPYSRAQLVWRFRLRCGRGLRVRDCTAMLPVQTDWAVYADRMVDTALDYGVLRDDMAWVWDILHFGVRCFANFREAATGHVIDGRRSK